MPHDQAAALFDDLETHLLQASELQFRLHVTATGAVTADLEGSMTIDGHGTTVLAATGNFAGEEVVLRVTGKGDSMLVGSGPVEDQAPRPAGLSDPPTSTRALSRGCDGSRGTLLRFRSEALNSGRSVRDGVGPHESMVSC